ncbi:MAG: hypothetical protein N2651_05880 [Fimbriimonadales bacterium]|nr:hypothetical protein [Fimbriimonadales bacterium]
MQAIRTALWVVGVFVLWLGGYLVIAVAAAYSESALSLLRSAFGNSERIAQYLGFLIGLHQFMLLVIVVIMLAEPARALWRWVIQQSQTEPPQPDTPSEPRGAG